MISCKNKIGTTLTSYHSYYKMILISFFYNCRLFKRIEVLFMEEIRFHEGELNVMELLWSNSELAAKDIARIIKEYVGWKKNTTYTVIKRLIEKGAILREDPGFICKARITKETVRITEIKRLLDNFFDSSLSKFISEYLVIQDLTQLEMMEMKQIIKKYEQKYLELYTKKEEEQKKSKS